MLQKERTASWFWGDFSLAPAVCFWCKSYQYCSCSGSFRDTLEGSFLASSKDASGKIPARTAASSADVFLVAFQWVFTDTLVSSAAFHMTSFPVSFSGLPAEVLINLRRLPACQPDPTVISSGQGNPANFFSLENCNHILPSKAGLLALGRGSLSQVWVLSYCLRVFFSSYLFLVANYLYMVNNSLL